MTQGSRGSFHRLSPWLGGIILLLILGIATARRWPQREAAHGGKRARFEIVSLAGHLNARLDRTWQPVDRNLTPAGENELSELPRGYQEFAGVPFHPEGVAQLSGTHLKSLGGDFPSRIGGIRIDRTCRKVHFLLATSWREREGVRVGSVVLRSDDRLEELPLLYGVEVRDWWAGPDEPPDCTRSTVAWTGSNSMARIYGRSLRLFRTEWVNPKPDRVVETMDFVSSMSASAPFLVAVTVEKP